MGVERRAHLGTVASMPSSLIDDVIVTRDGDLLAFGRSQPFEGPPEPRAWRSSDGRAWEAAHGVPELFYPAVEGDRHGYVMVGRRGVTSGSVPDVTDLIEVWRSDDGDAWEAVTLPADLQTFEPFRLAAGERGFVLTGCPRRGEPTLLATGPDCFTLGSPDGRVWALSDRFPSRIAVAPYRGTWIAASQSRDGSHYELWRSQDGVTWEQHGSLAIAATDVQQLLAVGNRIVFSVEPYMRTWTSSDAHTWQEVPIGGLLTDAEEIDGAVVVTTTGGMGGGAFWRGSPAEEGE